MIRKFIDSHVHAFPPRLFNAIWQYFETNYWTIYEKKHTPDIIPYLSSQGVTYLSLLLYAHKPGIAPELNNWMYHVGVKYKNVIPFGTIHANDLNIREEVDRVLSPTRLDLKGIKLQLMVTDFDPNASNLDPMYEKLIETNKVLVMHVGTGPNPKQLLNQNLTISPHVGIKKLYPVLERFPTLKLQIPHLGCMECDEFFNLALDYPSVMFDTAMALEFVFRESETPIYSKEFFLEKFTELQDKIMFGSDYPNLPYPYSHSVASLHELKLDEKIKEKIWITNAQRFYQLE
jgi:predicted TIM-barrel fold metal-dependent hydrolase